MKDSHKGLGACVFCQSQDCIAALAQWHDVLSNFFVMGGLGAAASVGLESKGWNS
jgi:hypothetical protein